MKNIYLIATILGATLMSCVEDTAEELTTITKEVDLTQTYEVRVVQGQLTYSVSKTIDASQNDVFAQFGTKIDNILVNSVSYTILDNANYDNGSDASIVDATIDFKKSDATSINVASISNLNLASALGVSKDLGFDQNALNELAAEIKATNTVSTDATIQLDNPVSFDIEVTINLSVSGSVIN